MSRPSPGIVRVTATGATEVHIDDLVDLQGDLKDLTVEAYETGKAAIIKNGFCEPLGLWKMPDGRWAVLSGKQRWRVLQTMFEEGWQVPLLPANIVEATTEEEALERALSLAGAWGVTSQEGLYEILHRMGGDAEEKLKTFRTPNINNAEYLRGFFKDYVPPSADDIKSRIDDAVGGKGLLGNHDGPTDFEEDPIERMKFDYKRKGVKDRQLWKLGRHRLLVGNSLEDKLLKNLIGNRDVDVVYTDPPYGISKMNRRADGRNGKSPPRKELAGDVTPAAATKAFEIARDMIKPIIRCFWGANFYPSCLPDGEYKWLVWDKKVLPTMTFSRAELAWTNMKGRTDKFDHLWVGPYTDSEKGEKRVHPTQKPVALAEWFLKEFTKPEHKVVLDFFGGSGSTLLACEREGKTCLIGEIDATYCEVIIARWENLTGKRAEMINDLS